MEFTLKNFGKISKAEIKLDGITVICGNNDTGKSTVGKALFSFCNALNNYKERILLSQVDTIIFFVRNAIFKSDAKFPIPFDRQDLIKYINTHSAPFSFDELKKYLEERYTIKLKKEAFLPLIDYLNTPEEDILNELIFRYFNNVMNGQIKRANSANGQCIVTAKIKGEDTTLKFTAQKCQSQFTEPITHSAYYINSPFALDYLNQNRGLSTGLNPMEKKVINAITNAQSAISEDSMANIFESVANKNNLETVRNVLKQAYKGNTRLNHGQYYYIENEALFDIRNLSAGLKAFALIERLLETGVLKAKDVLILDEPEIHLHSEWQIIYAELIVILQKAFDLTILLVTHSFQFLESLEFFMNKHEISERGNYYISEMNGNGAVITSENDSLHKMKKNLKSGMFTLADMKLDELNDGDVDEEDN